jgi:hypothetical protein
MAKATDSIFVCESTSGEKRAPVRCRCGVFVADDDLSFHLASAHPEVYAKIDSEFAPRIQQAKRAANGYF